MKYILIICIAWLAITILAVIMAINKQKHFNNHRFIEDGMEFSEARKLLGGSFIREECPEYTKYVWQIKNKNISGINYIEIHEKNGKVINSYKEHKIF